MAIIRFAKKYPKATKAIKLGGLGFVAFVILMATGLPQSIFEGLVNITLNLWALVAFSMGLGGIILIGYAFIASAAKMLFDRPFRSLAWIGALLWLYQSGAGRTLDAALRVYGQSTAHLGAQILGAQIVGWLIPILSLGFVYFVMRPGWEFVKNFSESWKQTRQLETPFVSHPWLSKLGLLDQQILYSVLHALKKSSR